jgi:hypothetical protein
MENFSIFSVFRKGSGVAIRTVTHTYVGIVRDLSLEGTAHVALCPAAWIADSGRWGEFIATGSIQECEPIRDGAIVFLGAAVDAAPWSHAIPSEAR